MTEKLSTLHNAVLQGGDYLFVIANESRQNTPIQKALQREVPHFGAAIDTKGWVAQAHETNPGSIFEEFKDKPWPPEILARIENERSPFMLILQTDFDKFGPTKDNWFIVWFSGIGRAATAIGQVFDALGREVKSGRDLFEFLETKIDGTDRSFPAGSLSSRDHPTAVKEPRTKGKKSGVLDREFGLVEALPGLIAKAKIKVGEHGWKMDLARVARKFLVKKGFDPKLRDKSVYGALQTNKLYEKLEKEQRG